MDSINLITPAPHGPAGISQLDWNETVNVMLQLHDNTYYDVVNIKAVYHKRDISRSEELHSFCILLVMLATGLV